MSRLHRQTSLPNDQPYASSQLSENSGNRKTFIRTSLKVTGPFLVVGACTAVAMAAGSPANDGPQTKSSNAGAGHSLVTHTSVNSSTTTPAASTTTTNSSSTGGPGTGVTHSYSISNSGGANTQVTVDGQPVSVPPNGTVQKTYTSPDGSTSINMSTSNQSNGTDNGVSSSYTSTDISSNVWLSNGNVSNTYTDGSPMQ